MKEDFSQSSIISIMGFLQQIGTFSLQRTLGAQHFTGSARSIFLHTVHWNVYNLSSSFKDVFSSKRYLHKGEHYRDLYEWPHYCGKGCSGIYAKDRDCNGDGNLKIVA